MATFSAIAAIASGALLAMLMLKPELLFGALTLIFLCSVGLALEEAWKAHAIRRRYH
jgi:hypothetical protein